MSKDTDFLEYRNVEPHTPLLRHPPPDALLYKIMKLGDFIRSVEHGYLHFQRVDKYQDFPTADARDGEQLPLDRAANAATTFERTPDYSAADYYDSCRARTYASCFSLENSPLVWQRYGDSDSAGKVGLVFNFGKLRAVLNDTVGNEPGRSALMVGGTQCKQIFNINYGLVDYVDVAVARANEQQLPNPIMYSYMKDAKAFAGEAEVRITLSTLGIGNFLLADGTIIRFPESMQLAFDFMRAIQHGTILRLLCSDADVSCRLADELGPFRIEAEVAAGREEPEPQGKGG